MPRKIDDLSSLGDYALLARYADGEGHAAEILTERLGGTVLAQAYHRLQNRADAEDVTQEAFLRLWKIAPDWQDRAKISTWLYRVTENLCIDRLRKRREVALDTTTEQIADPHASASASDNIDNRKRIDALYRAIDTLPERQQEAIRLRHLLELPNPEIAERMDISVEAVESLLSRGRRKLSSLLINRKPELGYIDDAV